MATVAGSSSSSSSDHPGVVIVQLSASHGWLPLKLGAASAVHAAPCSPIASSSGSVTGGSEAGGWSSVTPAVWLVAFVSMTYGYLQAAAMQLGNTSKRNPHFMSTFFPQVCDCGV